MGIMQQELRGRPIQQGVDDIMLKESELFPWNHQQKQNTCTVKIGKLVMEFNYEHLFWFAHMLLFSTHKNILRVWVRLEKIFTELTVPVSGYGKTEYISPNYIGLSGTQNRE